MVRQGSPPMEEDPVRRFRRGRAVGRPLPDEAILPHAGGNSLHRGLEPEELDGGVDAGAEPNRLALMHRNTGPIIFLGVLDI
jgi:hypothetical protein